MSDTGALVEERGKTHGNYADHARVTQRLKLLVREEMIRCRKVAPSTTETFGPVEPMLADDPALDAAMFESLDTILHKIGRIVAGKAGFADHWADIAGYAHLVAKQIESA